MRDKAGGKFTNEAAMRERREIGGRKVPPGCSLGCSANAIFIIRGITSAISGPVIVGAVCLRPGLRCRIWCVEPENRSRNQIP